MELAGIFLGIVGAILAGAISPGPSFILVCRTAMLYSRKAGIIAAFGMGLGGAFFACIALVGLSTLLREIPSLYVGLKVLGGFYLLYLGYQIWCGAKESLSVGTTDKIGVQQSFLKVFWLSLMTQISNPKTAIVYSSIFAAFLPQDAPLSLMIVLVPGIFLAEFTWYAFVALLFSNKHPRNIYLGAKMMIDRAVGLILGLLGGRLLLGGLEGLINESK